MRPGPRNLITDVAGLRVGNAEDHDLRSGATVLVGDRPFTAAVHVMGGAPGTRETDLLAPDKLVQEVDALVLSALSMNVSMSAMQDALTRQVQPLSPAQREQVQAHPEKSAEMLVAAGVQDTLWVDVGRRHHDATTDAAPDSDAPARLARLLRRVDIYTAKLSPRTTRSAMAADRAGRAMFMYDPGNSMTAALVKEFGVYPPGCFVKLVSGETAVVVKRGPSVVTPLVAALTTPSGAALIEPQPRDTSKREHAIAGVVGGDAVPVRIAPEKLMTLALA